MTDSLYDVLVTYNMYLACSHLQTPLRSLDTGEDLIFRRFGSQVSNKDLRQAIRSGCLSEVVSYEDTIPSREWELVFGKDLSREDLFSRAQYLDSRIRAHLTRP